MSFMLKPEEIKVHIFSPSKVHLEDQTIYNRTYQVWKKIWKDTFHQLENDSTVFSDEFTRQSEIISFLHQGECIATIFMNYVDFDLNCSRDDSYFRAWSDNAIEKLLKAGNKVAIGSNISVHPEYRGPILNGSALKNLTLDIAIQRLKEINFDVMTGTMRCNKGMESAAYKCKAVALEKNITFHNVSVDLVAFYKNTATLAHPELSQIIWNNRTIHMDSDFQFSYAAA